MYNGKSTPIQLVPPGSVSSPFNSFNIFHSLSSGEGIDIWKKYLQTVFDVTTYSNSGLSNSFRPTFIYESDFFQNVDGKK